MLLRSLRSKFIGFKLNLIFVNNNGRLLLSYIYGAQAFFYCKKRLFGKKAKIIFLIKLFFIIKFSF